MATGIVSQAVNGWRRSPTRVRGIAVSARTAKSDFAFRGNLFQEGS